MATGAPSPAGELSSRRAAGAATHNERGQIHLVPVLLDQRRRLFEGLGAEYIELERRQTSSGEAVVIPCTTA